jgi:hypothetical protein
LRQQSASRDFVALSSTIKKGQVEAATLSGSLAFYIRISVIGQDSHNLVDLDFLVKFFSENKDDVNIGLQTIAKVEKALGKKLVTPF